MSETYPPAQESLPSSETDQAPAFEGVWIPGEILDMNIRSSQKMLWSLISSLSRPDKPCSASNECLAKWMHCSEGHLKANLSELRRLGLIKQVGFNGRERLMVAILSPR